VQFHLDDGQYRWALTRHGSDLHCSIDWSLNERCDFDAVTTVQDFAAAVLVALTKMQQQISPADWAAKRSVCTRFFLLGQDKCVILDLWSAPSSCF